MRLFLSVLGLFAALCVFHFNVQSVSAFTNGTLLPYYICGPPTDGLPKSLGGYLTYALRPSAGNGTLFNAFTTPRLDGPLDVANGGSITNTQLVVANWHNRNSITACKNVMFVTSVLASNNAITSIVPGQLHTLTLTINAHPNAADVPVCDTYTAASQVTADDIANIALDGAVIYAINATGARVGTFTAFGDPNLNGAPNTMQSWVACGAPGMGIVHNNLISETGQYFGIQWQAPLTLVPGTSVTFKGAAVSDGGFGPHASTIPIITPAAAGIKTVVKPTVTAVKEVGNKLAVFFNDWAKNAPAANLPIAANSFTATATNKAGTVTASATGTKSPVLITLTPALKGQTLTVTVTGSNTVTTPTPIPSTSNPFTVNVNAGAVSNVVDPAVLLSLCPGDQVAMFASFAMDTDQDNQCAFQTAMVQNSNLTTAAGATILATTITTSSGMDTTSMAVIIGAAVGGAAILAIAIVGYLCWKRSKDNAQNNRVSNIQNEFTGVQRA